MRVETREEYASAIIMTLKGAIDYIDDYDYDSALGELAAAIELIKQAQEKFDQ